MCGHEKIIDLGSHFSTEVNYLRALVVEKQPIFNTQNHEQLLESAQSHRLIPLLHKRISKMSSPVLSMQLDSLHLLNKMEQLKLSAELIRLQLLLDEEKIPGIWLKGPLLSQYLYGDPTERTSGDLDLLVPEEYVQPLLSTLEQQGYQVLTYFSTPKQFDAILRYAHHIILYNESVGVKVELHWKLSGQQIAWPATRTLIDRSECIDLGSVKLNQLERGEYFYYLCVHGCSHGFFRLQWLVDCYFFLQKLNEVDFTFLTSKTNKVPLAVTFELLRELFEVPFRMQLSLSRSQQRRTRILFHESLSLIAMNEEIEQDSKKLSFRWKRMCNYLRIAYAFGGIGSLLRALFGRNVRPENWRFYAFPDHLFFLNYLFARFIWLFSKLKR